MKKDRRTKILELIHSRPYVSLVDLENAFPNVSSMTLRRDMDFFEEEGECFKVRGGVRSTRFIVDNKEFGFSVRQTENVDAKDRIAKIAATYLETGRSIFIDSGSTLQHLIQYIPNERFTFTTSNPKLALELSQIGQPVVNLVGGRLDNDYKAVYGPKAMKFISDMNIDIALMSATGLSAAHGCTCGNESEAEFKQAVIEKAQQVILLLDVSKAGKSLPYTFCNLDQINMIITDSELPDEIKQLANASNVEMVFA